MIRNKEFALEIFLSVLILLVFTLLSFFRPSPFLLPSAATLIILNHFIYTKRRYSAIKRLTDEITNVLHGYSASPRFGNLEGEISILKAEIGKMAGRLLESAEKLAADKRFLSDVLSDISHQLRTPLTAMNLTLSLLSEEAVSPERREALIRELLRSLKKIDWLIEALLKMSRLDAGAVQQPHHDMPGHDVAQSGA